MVKIFEHSAVRDCRDHVAVNFRGRPAWFDGYEAVISAADQRAI